MNNFYPIVTVADPAACRDFYVKAFEARVLFDADWFVHLAIERWEIGFLRPNPPVKLPVFQHATLSRGLTFAIEVEHAGRMIGKLRAKGIEPLGEANQSSTGEIAFSVMDPAGVVLNIVEIKPDTSEVVEL